MINRKIGSFIASLRKEQNLTQEAFAEKLGVSNRSVSRWENGKTLPDISLMQAICEITGATLPELLTGTRQTVPSQREDILLPLLDLFDREKQVKTKRLNWWFAVGFVLFLCAVLLHPLLTQAQSLVLAGLGCLFQCIGFYHNNCDHTLTDREKAILTAAKDTIRMRHPEDILTYVRKNQNIGKDHCKDAFQKICKELDDREHISFAMIAEEYTIDGAPGVWHAAIAVTQDRVFLCGEIMVGMLMPRLVLHIYKCSEITSIQYTAREISMKTPREKLVIRGELTEHLGKEFQAAIQSAQQHG